MKDQDIVDLYWVRDEQAIKETTKKYHHYLLKIAYNILANMEDCKECVNDTYLKAWYSMPTARPRMLSTYLGKIVRHKAIDLFRKNHNQKRKGSQYTVALEELENCLSSGNETEREIEFQQLVDILNHYVRALPPERRHVFISRYYYMDSIRAISHNYDMSESKVKSMLYRIRNDLRDFLQKEGFVI